MSFFEYVLLLLLLNSDFPDQSISCVDLPASLCICSFIIDLFWELFLLCELEPSLINVWLLLEGNCKKFIVFLCIVSCLFEALTDTFCDF